MIKVSVIMAINKFDDFTEIAIESILKQTYKNFEFLVVVNNCTDSDFELINTCCNDHRINIYRNTIPQLPYSLNFALDHAKGEYIARMDADDISSPERLMKQVLFLDSNPNISVVGCSYSLIDEKGNITADIKATLTPKKIYEKLPLGTQLCHPSVMMRKKDIFAVGCYCYGFFAEDYDLWLRLIRSKPYCLDNLPDNLFKYRVHSLQSTNESNVIRNKSYNYSLLLMNYLQTKRLKFLLGFLWLNPIFVKIKDNLIKKIRG
jgi:glycosyltransferase involved in cell wall biosynthesis